MTQIIIPAPLYANVAVMTTVTGEEIERLKQQVVSLQRKRQDLIQQIKRERSDDEWSELAISDSEIESIDSSLSLASSHLSPSETAEELIFPALSDSDTNIDQLTRERELLEKQLIDLESILKTIQESQIKIRQVDEQLATIAKERNRLFNDLTVADDKLTILTAKLESVEVDRDRIQGDFSSEQVRSERLTTDLATIEDQKNQLQGEKSSLESELIIQQNQVASLQRELNAKANQLTEKEARVRLLEVNLRSWVDEFINLDEARRERDDQRNQNQELRRNLNTARADLEVWTNQFSIRTAQEIQRDLTQLTDDLAQSQTDLGDKQDEITALQREVGTRDKKITALQTDLNTAIRERDVSLVRADESEREANGLRGQLQNYIAPDQLQRQVTEAREQTEQRFNGWLNPSNTDAIQREAQGQGMKTSQEFDIVSARLRELEQELQRERNRANNLDSQVGSLNYQLQQSYQTASSYNSLSRENEELKKKTSSLETSYNHLKRENSSLEYDLWAKENPEAVQAGIDMELEMTGYGGW